MNDVPKLCSNAFWPRLPAWQMKVGHHHQPGVLLSEKTLLALFEEEHRWWCWGLSALLSHKAHLLFWLPTCPVTEASPPPDIVTAWVRGHVSALYQSFISTNCIKCQQESHWAAVIGSFFFLIEQVIKLWWLSLKMCILINTYSHLSKQQINLSPCRRHNAASH